MGVVKFADGKVYTGMFAESKQHGHGTLTYPTGTVYVGEWADG